MPPTVMCQLYLLFLQEWFARTFAAWRLDDSRLRQPHEFVCPVDSCGAPTNTVLPQSHRHFHIVLPLLLDNSSSISIAVNLPNRLAARSSRRFIPRWQPHDAFASVFSSVNKRTANLPQTHSHSHASLPCLSRVGPITTNAPKRIPLKSDAPSFSILAFVLNLSRRARPAHPHDFVVPCRRHAPLMIFSVPHSQRQIQKAPFFFWVCENDNTVSFPNVWPVISIIFCTAYASNNNAAGATHAMLSRQRVMHRRRGYQYSTCARCLDKFIIAQERG